jgi:hypothetical protein
MAMKPTSAQMRQAYLKETIKPRKGVIHDEYHR